MKSELTVVFGRPAHGWMACDVTCGEHAVRMEMSHARRDTVADFVQAIAVLAAGADHANVIVLEEPGEWNVVFDCSGDALTLTMSAYTDHRRGGSRGQLMFEYQGFRVEVCLVFWRALRRLESLMTPQEFKESWGYEFSTEELRKLTLVLHEMKVGRRDGQDMRPHD